MKKSKISFKKLKTSDPNVLIKVDSILKKNNVGQSHCFSQLSDLRAGL